MYHRTEIIGNVGRDPESRFTAEGKQVTSFSVAVNVGYGDNKSTAWYRVEAWEKLAETCAKYVKKGMKVFVEGGLKFDKETGGPRIWESNGVSKASFELRAYSVRFLSKVEYEQETLDDVDDVFA